MLPWRGRRIMTRNVWYCPTLHLAVGVLGYLASLVFAFASPRGFKKSWKHAKKNLGQPTWNGTSMKAECHLLAWKNSTCSRLLIKTRMFSSWNLNTTSQRRQASLWMRLYNWCLVEYTLIKTMWSFKMCNWAVVRVKRIKKMWWQNGLGLRQCWF